MATEDWIQESLARLESLEEERKKHEEALETASDPATLRMHTESIERLEVKIRKLYAELEAVAEEAGGGGSDGEAADGDDDVPTAVTAGDESGDAETRVFRSEDIARPVAAAPVAARPALSPAPAAAPFSSSSAAPPSPFGDAPSAPPFGSPAAEAPAISSSGASASFDAGDDGESSGGGSKVGLILGLVLLIGGGAAAYVFLGGKKEDPPPQVAPTEVKVIKSGDVPPDTQGPRTAKGADIAATQGSQIKETNRGGSGGGGGGGGGGSSTPTSDAPKKKKDDKKTKIESTDDPLAGIN